VIGLKIALKNNKNKAENIFIHNFQRVIFILKKQIMFGMKIAPF